MPLRDNSMAARTVLVVDRSAATRVARRQLLEGAGHRVLDAADVATAVMLVGFRSRVVVLVDWAWNYLTYDRGLRAILGSSPADDPPAETTTGSAPEETLPARVAGGGFEPPTSRL